MNSFKTRIFFQCAVLFLMSALPSIVYSKQVDSKKLLHRYINLTTNKYSGKVLLDPSKSTQQVLLALKEINPEFVNNFLVIKLHTDTSVTAPAKMLIELKFTNGWHSEDTIILPAPSCTAIICPDSVANGNGVVSSYSLYLLADQNSRDQIAYDYDLEFKSSIISWRAFVYLAIMLIYTFLMLYFIKWENFTLLAEKRWHSKWHIAVSLISQAFLIMMLLDEVGLLLKEWDMNAGFFGIFRNILELPGLSQVLLLANLGLVVPAGYSLSSIMIGQMAEANKGRFSEWNDLPVYKTRYSLFMALFLINVSILFFLAQCFVFDEFNMGYTHGLIIYAVFIILLLLLPILVLFKLISIQRRISKENNPFRHHPWLEKESFFITFLVCFLSLTQTMITKVLLLLSIISWAKPAVRKITGLVITKARSLKNNNSGRSFEGIVKGLSSSSGLDRWNFIFLTTSFLPLILLFQIHCSPYPPSDSAFPKTETVSSLYMMYMILFLFIGGKKWIKWLTSIIWLIVTIFILYLTPVFFPTWFYPSLDPPGFSFIDAVRQFSNEFTAGISLMIVHFIVAITCMLMYYSINIKQSLIDNGYQDVRKFRLYFFIGIWKTELIYIVIIPLFFYIIGNSDIFSTAKFMSDYGIMISTAGKIMVFAIIIPAAVLMLLSLGLKKEIAEMHSGIMHLAGEDAVNRIRKNFRLVNYFKSWNKAKDNFRIYLVLSIPAFLLLSLNILAFRIPGPGSKEMVSLVWHYPLEEGLTYYSSLRKFNDILTCFSPEAVTAFNSGTGEKVWQIRKRINSYDMTDNGKLCILSGYQLMMIECDSGKTIWSTIIQYDRSDRKAYPDISIYQGIIAVAHKNKVIIIDEPTGQVIDQSDSIRGRLSRSLGGLPCWANSSNELLQWQSPGKTRNLINVKDSITKIFSFREAILTVTVNEIMCISEGGDLLWKRKLENGNYVSDAFVGDSLVIIDRKSGLIGCRLADGSSLWERPEDSFVRIDDDPYNPAINSLAAGNRLAGRLLTTDYKNMYQLDKNSGKVIIKFKNVNDENGLFRLNCIGVSNNLICSFDAARMDVYDPGTGEKLYYSFYLKPVFDLEPGYYRNNFLSIAINYGLLFQDNIIYMGDSKGLNALKVQAGNLP